MRPTVHRIVLAALAALIGGCATTAPTPEECDPTKGGFFGGVRCSGTYQKRIDSRQEELQSEMSRRAELATRQESLDQERAALSQQVADRVAERSRIERELGDLQRKIDAGRSDDAALEQRARELREQRSSVDSDLQAKATRISELEQEMDALEAEADAY